MVERIPATSVDFLRVPVVEANVDPTGYPVSIALMPDTYQVGATAYTEPDAGDWIPVQWAAGVGPPYVARLLLEEEATGDYQVWVRIVGLPERPVRRVGRIVRGNAAVAVEVLLAGVGVAAVSANAALEVS